jgi:PAS domain S-box-containing protein
MMKGSSKAQALTRELDSRRQKNREMERFETKKTKTFTPRKSAFTELQNSERKYRQFVENAHDYIICMDMDGVIQYVNRAARDLSNPINLVGLPMSVVISPDQLKRHEELLQKRKEGDVTVYSYEWDIVHPGSGRRIILDVRSSALMEDGRPSGVLTIGRDVTYKKIREKNLLAAKEKYQMLVEGVNDIIFEIDNQGVFLYCNPIGKEIWGYDTEEVIARNIIEFIYSEDRDRFRKFIAEDSIEKGYQLVLRTNTKTGEVRWVRACLSPRIENGKFLGATGILIDINEQKRMYDELRVQEIQLRAVIESTGNGILALDHAGDIIMSNQRYAEIWHVPSILLERKDVRALRGYVSSQVVDPDTFLGRIRDLSQSTELSQDVVLLKDGRILERYFYPMISENIMIGRVLSYRDITDQHRMEQTLRDSELLFKSVFAISPAMMSIHRLSDGTFLEINQIVSDYTGYMREEIIGHTIAELDIVEPTVLERLRNILSERNAVCDEEIQYKTKTGVLRYGLYSAALIENNEEKKVLGVLFDITKRKYAEGQLKLREEESQKLAKSLEETNIALRVVLSRQEEERKFLEERIQCNVNEIILPLIGSLTNADLKKRDKHCLYLLESNLKSILSPFLKNMSNICKRLTPKEILIAEMIRQGKNSKDIADMLSASVATINTHRNNIRKKLNITKQRKTNLRSHLLSLS